MIFELDMKSLRVEMTVTWQIQWQVPQCSSFPACIFNCFKATGLWPDIRKRIRVKSVGKVPSGLQEAWSLINERGYDSSPPFWSCSRSSETTPPQAHAWIEPIVLWLLFLGMQREIRWRWHNLCTTSWQVHVWQRTVQCAVFDSILSQVVELRMNQLDFQFTKIL